MKIGCALFVLLLGSATPLLAQGSVYYFPQFVDGLSGGGFYSSALSFSNVVYNTNTVTIHFFKSDGTAWVVDFRGFDRPDAAGRVSTTTFTLAPGESAQFFTGGLDPLTVGWVNIQTTYPLMVSGTYNFSHTASSVVYTNWTAATLPGSTATEFSFFADVSSNSYLSAGINTGVAIANPSGATATVTAALLNRTGAQVRKQSGSDIIIAPKTITLLPNQQTALFVNQLFNDFTFPSTFHGTVRLSSNVNIAVVALQGVSSPGGDVFSLVPVNPDSTLGTNIFYDREPNDTIGTAQVITLPARIIGTSNSPTDTFDQDCFSFTLQPGQTVSILAAANLIGSPLDDLILLYNPSGILVADNDNFSPPLLDPYVSYYSPSMGTYTACHRSTGGTSSRNSYYELLINAVPFISAPPLTPFTVISTIPINGATGVPTDQQIMATFSQAVNCSTITTSTFTVSGPGGTPVTGTILCSGTSGTFTPTSSLAPNTTFTATITTGVTNVPGTALASNFVWSFRTASTPSTAPPTVIFTDPANNATGVPINKKITATFSEAMDPTTISATTFTLAGPGGFPVNGTVTYDVINNIAIFTPTGTLAPNATFIATITIGVQNVAGTAMANSFVWSFKTGSTPDTTPPTVTSTNPANGATGVPINHAVSATFSKAMDPTTISATTFTLTGPGATPVSGAVTYAAVGNTATFTPTSTLAPNTTFTATITTGVRDIAGNALASNFVWSFTTAVTPDTTPPTVTSTNPANGATGVPINHAVSATFSKAMDLSTISTATFTLTGPGATPVSGAVTYAAVGNTATFTPTSTLAPNTTFTATITTGVRDIAGNALASNFLWSFTTGATPDTTPPTVISTNPANGATGVCINKTVNATFSKAMNLLTISTATFTLTGPGSVPVTGTVSYDVTSKVATFIPTSTLAPNTTFTATITTGATDLAGNALASNFVWMFTTGATTCQAPVVLGAAAPFGVFGGGAGMTNQGILTVINGDIGTTGVSTTVTGFHDAGVGCIYTETPLNIGTVNGNIYTAPPPPTSGCLTEGTAATFAIATQGALAALTAYNALAARPGGPDPGAGQLGGLVLAPGSYTAASGSFQITGSDLTLDAMGDPNAVWIFQMATSLTVGAPGAPRSVILANGAQAKNVFWQVGSAATINGAGGGNMVGTIIARAGVTFSTAGNVAITTLDGRALGLNASVTVVNTVINVPAP
jgi:hypothetical protein